MKKGFRIISTIAMVIMLLALSIPAMVSADTVVNDVVVDGNDTFTAGSSTTISYWFEDPNNHPSGDRTGDNSGGGPNLATITIIVPDGVTATPASVSPQGTGLDTAKAVVFKSDTPGDYAISVTVTGGKSGSLWNTDPANFTLHVKAAESTPTEEDTTPPVIEPKISGTLGNNDWYVSDVTVTFSASDDESEITSTDPSGNPYSYVLTADTTGTTVTYSATSEGGTSSDSVTVKIDKTAPTISGFQSPAANSNGWNNTDVTVGFSASDDTSGIASVSGLTNLSGEGAGQSVTGTAIDNAGNSASVTVSGINIDKTPPSITGSRSPDANGNGWNNTDVTVSFSASDDLSGIDSVSDPTILSGEGAGQSVTGTAFDKAGNSATAIVDNINIDKNPPVVDVTGPSLLLQGASAAASWTASDALSGVIPPSSGTIPLDTTTAGAQTVVATASDLAGNIGTDSLTYTVWSINGPFAPLVKNGNGTGQYKAGSTIPVKFQLTDGTSLITTATGTVTIGSASASFRWDDTAQQYIANVKTAKAATGTFDVVLAVNSVGSQTLASVTIR